MELISKQAVLDILEDCDEDMETCDTEIAYLRARSRIYGLHSQERKFIEKIFETLREMDEAVDIICNLDVDAVLDIM